MSDLFRESPIGQLLRYATGNKVLKYPEELPGWQCPESYRNPDTIAGPNEVKEDSEAETPTEDTTEPEKAKELGAENEAYEDPLATNDEPNAIRAPATRMSTKASRLSERPTARRNSTGLTRVGTLSLERTPTQADLRQVKSRVEMEAVWERAQQAEEEKQIEKETGENLPIVPQKTADGKILVDWYTTDDPDNPQNWSSKKKVFVAFVICTYTFTVYIGSAIYSSAEGYVIAQFGVSEVASSLGLALYVLAYGIGPLLFSPLSEIPAIGRNPPYLVSYAIFVILCVPTALTNNFAGLLVLRFLQGFFGSPCLATGGASLGDIYSLFKLPYALLAWASAATAGPALGPIIAGFSIPAETWHWFAWEMLWMSGPGWLLMFLCLPETSSGNILLRRARRLRKLTGDNRLMAQSEIDQGNLSASAIVRDSLLKPFQIMFLDPAVAFTAIYTSLVYGIYYSFFECFPLVYPVLYGFNLGETGLVFLSITVAVVVSLATYGSYQYYVTEPEFRQKGFGGMPPERRLIPALFASLLVPIGLFMFGWTANRDIHWIVSIIGIGIYTWGVIIILQCIFIYLPFTYPQYAASLFAGNDFARSSLAAGAILFARPLYVNLGVGRGISVMGGCTAGCIAGVYYLYFFGARMRARSKFAVA